MFFRKKRRSGYTMIELSMAVGVLAIVIPIVAQLAVWSLAQRLQTQSRQTAQELANNTLEAARACVWDDLTPAWAKARTIPDDLKPLLNEGTLTVTVEREKNQVRRVTAVVTWRRDFSGPPGEVKLATLLATRQRMGGEP